MPNSVAHEMWSVTLLIFLSLIAMVTLPVYLNKYQRVDRDEVPQKDQVCFEGLGCFDTGAPWSTPLRPVPSPQPPHHNPTTIFFFSRQNKMKPYRIRTYPEIIFGNTPFDGRRSTLLVVHGFMRNATVPWMQTLKDVYLEVVDANVLLTDWKTGALPSYPQTVSNTRVVGRVLSNFVRYLIDEYHLKPERVHLIGHSLGAHICSYIAKDIPGIGRLTALDPAQPGYEGCDAKTRVDKSDAIFVEVVHTDPKPFIPYMGVGMIAPHGHVDFYFNSGAYQPGCLVPDELPDVVTMPDLMRFPFEYPYRKIFCSHERAHEYLIEAYNTSKKCVFWGHKLTAKDIRRYFLNNLIKGIPSDLDQRWDACSKKECIPFGLDAVRSPLRGVVVVRTNFEPPYCLPEPWGYTTKPSGHQDNYGM